MLFHWLIWDLSSCPSHESTEGQRRWEKMCSSRRLILLAKTKKAEISSREAVLALRFFQPLQAVFPLHVILLQGQIPWSDRIFCDSLSLLLKEKMAQSSPVIHMACNRMIGLHVVFGIAPRADGLNILAFRCAPLPLKCTFSRRNLTEVKKKSKKFCLPL